jgi:hypothetical protein
MFHCVPMTCKVFLLLTMLQTDTLALQIQQAIKTGDSYQATEIMARQGDAKAVARAYIEVTRDLYRRLRDLPAFIVVSRQGIDYFLSRAAEADRTSPALAEELRGTAKTLAYNLASNTWPGWNEPGIRVTLSDIDAGMDAARLNLRLASDLKRGPDPMFNGHWIVGALELARGNHADAIRSYEQARQIANHANLRTYTLLAGGSIGIAKIAGKVDIAQGERELSQVKSALTSENLPDGKFFADQLDTAYAVFVKRARESGSQLPTLTPPQQR